MSVQLWVGVGLVVFLLLFLSVAFFTKDNLAPGQWKILQFFIALCGALASALFAGEATIKVNADIATGQQLVISGTAAFAVFFAIWFTFDRQMFPDAFHFNIPPGWKFEQAARAMAKHDNKVAEFIGFSNEELQAPLDPHELHAKTLKQALMLLKNLVSAGAVRSYSVAAEESLCKLQVS